MNAYGCLPLVAELFGPVQNADRAAQSDSLPYPAAARFLLGSCPAWVFHARGLASQILTARFDTFTTSPSLTCFLGSTPSPNIRQTYFVLVSSIISQGNSRLPAQLSTQIFAFNATAPTLFFAPFRGYYRERI